MSAQFGKRLVAWLGSIQRAKDSRLITLFFAALLAGATSASASVYKDNGSSTSVFGAASPAHLSSSQQRPRPPTRSNGASPNTTPPVGFPTTTVPSGSIIPWYIEWSCYTLSGPIIDTVSGQYSSVNPSGAGVTVTGFPSSVQTYQQFQANVNVAGSTPAGVYGVGVFGTGQSQYSRYCGPYAAAGYVQVLGSRVNLGCPSCRAGNQKGVGDPINVAAANLYEDELDFRSTIGTLPLKIERSFNSSNQAIGLFGDDWTSNLDVVLIGGSSAMSARLPDGQEISFNYNGSTWVPQTGVPATLVNNASGYLLTRTDTKDQYQFNSGGQITSQTNVRGETLNYSRNPNNTFQISTVTDNYGNSMSLTYYTYTSATGGTIYLVHTASVMGQTYTYTYDTTYFNLLSVSYTLNGQTVQRQYQYYAADPYQLTGIIDENGNQIANYSYDANDLPSHSDQLGTGSVDIDYTNLFSSSPSVTVTNANYYQQVYNLAYGADGTAYIASIAGVAGTGNSNVTPATTYTVNNNQDLPSITVNGNGYGTEYSYDSTRAVLTKQTSGFLWSGNQPITTGTLSNTTAMSQMQVTQMDTSFPYPDVIVYSGTNALGTLTNTKQINAGYDPTNGRTTSWKETDQTGNATSGASPRNWTYNYTYYDGAKSKVNTETIYGPRYPTFNDVTTLQFDSAGRLTQKTDGSGHSFTYSNFTALGTPQSIKDNQNGTTTQMTYDEKNRPKTITLAYGTASAEIEQLSYYPNGRLQQTMRPDGSSLTYSYDNAGHLTEIDDGVGNKSVFTPSTYDGQWTQANVSDANGNTTQSTYRAYDDIGRLLSVTGSYGERLHYAYDLDDNIQTSYQNGDATTELVRVYDALDRVQKLQHPPVGGSTPSDYITNTYDSTGAYGQVKDSRSLATNYTRDGLGNIVTAQSPDTGTTSFLFDAAGNATQRTDNKGQVLKYSYDSLNRLTKIVRADTNQTLAQFTYDQLDSTHTYGYGQLTSIGDLSGTTDFSYDAAGHLLSKKQVTNGVTLLTSYGYYQGTDEVQTMTLPSGNKLGYTWDANQRISSITLTKAGTSTASTLVSGVTYQPFNGPLSWTLGNGETVGRSYDYDGYVNGDPVDYGVDYSADKQMLTDTFVGGGYPFSAPNVVYSGYRSFTSDNFEHVKTLSGNVAIGSGSSKTLSLAYTSDSVDNRKTQTIGAAKTTYTLSTTSNQIAKSTKSAVTTTYYYDLNGSLTGTSATPVYSYDFLNRLTGYVNGSTSATYVFNGRNERVQKTVGATTTLFVYDQGGRLIGEYANSTTPIEETVYLGDMPIAVQEPSGTFYIHADFRDTPRQIDNASKQAMWAWDPEVYGDTNPDQNPPGAPVTTFVYNLRFPGQYYDAETGLFYNNHRTYSPTLGRYLQSDPLGAAAGLNTYAYVYGNPLANTDQLGLLCDGCEVPPSMGQAFADPSAGEMVIPAVTTAAAFLPVSDIFDGLILWNRLAKARKLGKLGEKAVCDANEIGPKVKISINGRKRIPDGLTDKKLSEIKNVQDLSYTQQLQDFADYAAQEGLDFDLYVRPDTYLSGPLLDAEAAGDVNIIRIPMR